MDLNLKGVDEGLVTKAKFAALQSNQTLKGWILGVLEDKLSKENQGGNGGTLTKERGVVQAASRRNLSRVRGGKKAVGEAVKPEPTMAAETGDEKCSVCGGQLIAWGKRKRCKDCHRNF